MDILSTLILTTFIAGVVGTGLGGLVGALLHVVCHSLVKDTLFMSAGAIIMKTEKTAVSDLKGIGKQMPVTLACFTVASLGLVGIPPCMGFISKWYLAQGSLAATGVNAVLNVVGPVILLISALLTAGYLLPISIDAFFGRTPAASAPQLPWEDDDTLRVVAYLGHKRMADYKPHSNGNLYGNLFFHLEGDAKNVQSELSLTVEGNVLGNATSGGSLTCGDITGEVRANGSVNCDSVEGNVSAGGSVNCDSIAGSVKAGGSVPCDDIGGDVTAGGSVTCDKIGGSCTQQ